MYNMHSPMLPEFHFTTKTPSNAYAFDSSITCRLHIHPRISNI